MAATFFEGLVLGLSLIIAIGAQNAFVLRQGLTGRFVFPTALICTFCDVVLIALGVGGLGTLIAGSPVLTAAATWGGATFLLWYGGRSFWAALRPGHLNAADGRTEASVRGVIIAALGFSLLNPHVYLDTVVLLGGLGARYSADLRWLFGAGAMVASAGWFFALAYGARVLAPLFARPAAWRVLDTAIGLIMWAIAGTLIFDALPGGFA